MNGIDELIPGSKIVLKKRIKPSKRTNVPNKEEDHQLWSQKHRPHSLKDFCGNKKEVKQILNWLKQKSYIYWGSIITRKKRLVLH